MENTVKYEDWLNKETFEVKQLPIGYGLWGSKWVKIPDDAEFAISNDLTLKFRKGSSWWSESRDQWVVGRWVKSDYPNCDYRIVWERKTPEVVKGLIEGDKMSNYRIKVKDELENKEVQKLLLEMGYEWMSTDQNYKAMDTYPSYIFCIKGLLTYGVKPYYEHHQLETQEITSTVLREMLQEKQATLHNKTSTQFIEQRTEVFKKLLQGVKFQYRYNDSGQWHNLTEKSMGHFLKPNVVVREKPQKPVIDGIEMDKEAAIKYIEKHY